MQRSRRRYKSGTNPTYDQRFDSLRVGSQILNGGNQKLNVHTILWDRNNLNAIKLELSGDETGMYIRDGQRLPAAIPAINNKLESIEAKFREYQNNRQRQGFAVTEEYPTDLHNDRSNLEATLDILTEELDEINRRLETFVEQEQKEDDSMVLIHGLACIGKLRDGILVRIDGQNVKEIDGVLVIVDDRSPYNGMSVPDYRELANRVRAERKDADRKQLLRLQAEAREKGQRIPQSLPIKSPSKVGKSSLPTWPAGVRNYLKDVPVIK